MYCINCGKGLPENSAFCPNCGASQAAQQSVPTQPPPSANASQAVPEKQKKKKPFYKRWWFIIIVAVVAIAVLAELLGGGENPQKTETEPPSLSETDPSQTPKPSPTPTPSPSPTPEPTLSPEELAANEQEFKDSCVAYAYKDIARNPDDFVFMPAYFKGEVIQVLEGGEYNTYRVNVTLGEYGFWEDTIYVEYAPEKGAPRILENDIIEIYGLLAGLVTYETIFGGSLSIPGIAAMYVDIVE